MNRDASSPRALALAHRLGLSTALLPAWRAIAAAVGLREGAFLELCCGAAWVSVAVADGRPAVDSVALEAEPDLLSRAARSRAHRLNVTLREMPPERIVYPNATFHAAACVCASRRWRDPAAVLAEVHRVLRPGAAFQIYEADAEAEGIDPGWLQPDLPAWLTRPALRRFGFATSEWDALKDTVRRSPFQGGEDGRHGLFRRLVLRRSP